MSDKFSESAQKCFPSPEMAKILLAMGYCGGKVSEEGGSKVISFANEGPREILRVCLNAQGKMGYATTVSIICADEFRRGKELGSRLEKSRMSRLLGL